MAQFLKKHEKSSICQKLCNFSNNYHVFAFRSTFQEKVAKSASFREKAREIIDLANTMQLFEQTTMFLHFDELLRKDRNDPLRRCLSVHGLQRQEEDCKEKEINKKVTATFRDVFRSKVCSFVCLFFFFV